VNPQKLLARRWTRWNPPKLSQQIRSIERRFDRLQSLGPLGMFTDQLVTLEHLAAA
jgi:hypothetical protein